MGTWAVIRQTAIDEFSDIADAEQLTRVVLRLVVAGLLGAVLGLQRERHGKEAGIRTHMAVAMGSALFVLVPLQAGIDAEGLSRVVQGLVAGIGFLCAGTILKLAHEEQVRGLTTAAGVWMTAAIGMAAGTGSEVTALLSTLLLLGVFALEGPLRRAGLRQGTPPPGD